MALIRSFDPRGMSLDELKYWHNSGQVSSTVRSMLAGKIAAMTPKAAPATATPAAAPATPVASDTSDMSAILKRLKENEGAFVASQHADIDKQTQRNIAQGMSNMIGSGLAGTTVVGGMTTGATEAGTRAKTNVATAARGQTENLALQYANLGQAAEQAALNRAFTSSEGDKSRAAGITTAQIGAPVYTPPRTSVPGLDAFGNPMVGSMQYASMNQSSSLASKYPNLGMVGQSAPRLF